MAYFDILEKEHIDFILNQHLFFVATSAPDRMINLSPKGLDSFRVLGPNKVIWLNLTGSGNETAAHVREDGRMTIMFCSFDKAPMILRLYGKAKTWHPRDKKEWLEYSAHFPEYISARQIFEMKVDKVQTSCGYAVPYFELKGERPTLVKWAEQKGEVALAEYQQEKNLVSLDEQDTGLNI